MRGVEKSSPFLPFLPFCYTSFQHICPFLKMPLEVLYDQEILSILIERITIFKMGKTTCTPSIYKNVAIKVMSEAKYENLNTVTGLFTGALGSRTRESILYTLHSRFNLS